MQATTTSTASTSQPEEVHPREVNESGASPQPQQPLSQQV